MTIKRMLTMAALLCAACSSSIEPDKEREQQETPASESDASTAEEPVDETPRELEVDASSMTDWAYLDLESARVVSPKTPAESSAWDLGLRRFAIALNGGASGAGGVGVSVLKDAAFEAVTEVPASFVTDIGDGSDDDQDPDYVMSTGETGWYDYNPSDHTLSPRAHVYVVKTVEKNIFKLVVLGYYNAAGSAGHVRLRFQLLARGEGGDEPGTPEPPIEDEADDAGVPLPTDASTGEEEPDAATGELNYETLTVTATSQTEWVRVKVGEGVVSAEAQSTGWDLAFLRTQIQTNSGTSGPGMGGARLLEGAFDAVEQTPQVDGFDVDAELPIPGPPGSGTFSGNPTLSGWYDYNPISHAVTPKALAYLVRTAGGGYAKLRIKAWADGVYTIDVGSLTAPR